MQKTAALFLTWDDTVDSLQVFTAMTFGLTTFIVLETNVIPSHVLLSFVAQGLQSLSNKLEFLMT